MGCDIHAYIEYSDADRESPHWSYFAKVHFSRNYRLFGILAGVRGGPAEFEVSGLILSELSYQTADEFCCYVVEDGEGTGSYTYERSKAKEYVERGSSVWFDDNLLRISNPDWHHPTWLSLEEILVIRKRYVEEVGCLNPTLEAVCASMQAFADCGQPPRLVIWFDN